MLPRLLGLILLAGGAWLVIAPRLSQRADSTIIPAESDLSPAGSPGLWALPALVGGLAAYVAALPWAGFIISTTVFASGLLWSLKVVWWRAILAGIILAAVADGLFSVVLKVPLPAGVWN